MSPHTYYNIILTVTVTILRVHGHTYSAYREQPCCHHHQQNEMKEFSCGTLFYRTMLLDHDNDVIYLGAMDRLFKLNMTDISQAHCQKDSLDLEPSDVAQCVSKGKSEDFECRNHVRVIQLVDDHKLYVCGTNAHSPKDWVIYKNLTHLPRHVHIPGIGQGTARCPYDPRDNSTAVWAKSGNPAHLSALYSGTNAAFTKADPVIFRTDLHDPQTGQVKHHFLRTLKYDSKWLDKTNFVGSFESGPYVFLFFRETAVEHMNCGKAVFSRVARICKMDKGGKHILTRNWTTYLKARLNCSIPGDFPFYFNEIQDVYQQPDDNYRFYAVFTAGSNEGVGGSAVCSFSMSSIQEAFSGKFKEQATSSSAWLPVLRNKVPEPRPGTCVLDTQKLPDDVLHFIRSHPLMDEAVHHDFNVPLFYKRDAIFTQLVVDRVFVDMLGANRSYIVIYVGTKGGQIYKIAQWTTASGHSESNLVDVWQVAPGEVVQSIKMSKKHNSLYVATDHRILQLPIESCAKRYDSCIRCVLDPYCGWDKDVGLCKPYEAGLIQDVTNLTADICDHSAIKKSLVVSHGQSVHLSAYFTMPSAFKGRHVVWYHFSKQKGRYKLRLDSGRVLRTLEDGLVILHALDSDRGRYDCYLGPTLIASYNLQVDSYKCGHPSKPSEYKKIYYDWCNEFEKYKVAMKAWEKKQLQCVKHNSTENSENATLR